MLLPWTQLRDSVISPGHVTGATLDAAFMCNCSRGRGHTLQQSLQYSVHYCWRCDNAQVRTFLKSKGGVRQRKKYPWLTTVVVLLYSRYWLKDAVCVACSCSVVIAHIHVFRIIAQVQRLSTYDFFSEQHGHDDRLRKRTLSLHHICGRE